MNNGYYYQLMASLMKEAGNYSYPRVLKDMLREGEITNVKQLTEFLQGEVTSAPLADQQSAGYFAFMCEHGLLFHLYREDFESFFQLIEAAETRMQNARNAPGVASEFRGWPQYFEYLRLSARRLLRHANLEEFENYIDHFDWSGIEKPFIQKISALTGFVYLNETDKERFGKSRFWLHKAVTESDELRGLACYLNLAKYFFTEGDLDSTRHIEDIINKLKTARDRHSDFGVKNLFTAAVLELQSRALLFRVGLYDDKQVKLQEKLASVKDIETNVAYEGKSAPLFSKVFLKLEFGACYRSLSASLTSRKEVSHILSMATENVNEGMRLAERMQDPMLVAVAQLHWMSSQWRLYDKVQEKEIKDVVNIFRKSDNYPLFLEATRVHARYFEDQDNVRKAFDVYFDALKTGAKKLDQGGYYLVTQTMEQINRILLSETDQPGVSFIVKELDPYFDKIIEITDLLETHLPHVGSDLFARFRSEFARMEPATHFNAKVYLRYQFYEVKILRISAIHTGDDTARRIADNLLRELEHKNNPLSFMSARWEDFKDIPNSVRNKMLNKCISITKGDLPAAADHLDFSYRNLRSYITFKEVNRLGFFLDELKTRNRQLETGIRLLFHDLYRDGTIFEVVFDMPRFLVETADSGFSSQDMEEALKIKGTTAKKYIKIMMDIDLIELEKSIGRKHFYRLRKDYVMTRLGKEQKVMSAESK